MKQPRYVRIGDTARGAVVRRLHGTLYYCDAGDYFVHVWRDDEGTMIAQRNKGRKQTAYASTRLAWLESSFTPIKQTQTYRGRRSNERI